MPRGHELHGAAERERQRDGRQVVLVDVDLDAERAADVGRDHPHAVLGQAEEIGQHRPHHVRHLRRDPHGERARRRIEIGDEAARLHRHAGVTAHPERAPVRAMGTRAGRVDVAGGELGRVDQVVGELVVDERRVGRQRSVGAQHGGQRIVASDDALGSILGLGPRLGGDHRDGLAHVAHAIGGQGQHGAGLHAPVVLEDSAIGLAEPRGVTAGQHARHAGRASCISGVDPDDAGVSVRAAHERDVDHARQRHVVHVAATAGEQARVVAAPGARAHVRHRGRDCTTLTRLGGAPMIAPLHAREPPGASPGSA